MVRKVEEDGANVGANASYSGVDQIQIHIHHDSPVWVVARDVQSEDLRVKSIHGLNFRLDVHHDVPQNDSKGANGRCAFKGQSDVLLGDELFHKVDKLGGHASLSVNLVIQIVFNLRTDQKKKI